MGSNTAGQLWKETPMYVIVPKPTRLQIIIKIMLVLLVIPAFLTFGHLMMARHDRDGLNDCERLAGIDNCIGLHGTYDEIYADCVAWPPVFTERLSEFVEPLCDVALSNVPNATVTDEREAIEWGQSPNQGENQERNTGDGKTNERDASDGATGDGATIEEPIAPTVEPAEPEVPIPPTVEPAEPEVPVPPTVEPVDKPDFDHNGDDGAANPDQGDVVIEEPSLHVSDVSFGRPFPGVYNDCKIRVVIRNEGRGTAANVEVYASTQELVGAGGMSWASDVLEGPDSIPAGGEAVYRNAWTMPVRQGYPVLHDVGVYIGGNFVAGHSSPYGTAALPCN